MFSVKQPEKAQEKRKQQGFKLGPWIEVGDGVILPFPG
jgi:hypothetical protein